MIDSGPVRIGAGGKRAVGAAALALTTLVVRAYSSSSASLASPSSSGSSSGTTNSATAAALDSAYTSVVNLVSPSVVLIETSGGLGSGEVYNNNGDIVTNAHVVGSATTFRV